MLGIVLLVGHISVSKDARCVPDVYLVRTQCTNVPSMCACTKASNRMMLELRSSTFLLSH